MNDFFFWLCVSYPILLFWAGFECYWKRRQTRIRAELLYALKLCTREISGHELYGVYSGIFDRTISRWSFVRHMTYLCSQGAVVCRDCTLPGPYGRRARFYMLAEWVRKVDE